MSNQELILYEVKNKIAIITINRSDKAHAFNNEMLEMMYENLIKADKNEKVKCIIIKATGERFFSAGYDLNAIMADRSIADKIIKLGRKVNYTILTIKKPVITQVQGIAVGFGVLMTMASDLRVFADRPKEELYIRLPELEISAFPQTGATLLPLLAFGFSYGKQLLFTADKVGLEELKNINFPTRVFPLDKLDEETFAFAKKVSKYQKEFSYFTKTMLNIMNKHYIKTLLDMEDECGAVAYARNKNDEELDEFIADLYKKYPKL